MQKNPQLTKSKIIHQENLNSARAILGFVTYVYFTYYFIHLKSSVPDISRIMSPRQMQFAGQKENCPGCWNKNTGNAVFFRPLFICNSHRYYMHQSCLIFMVTDFISQESLVVGIFLYKNSCVKLHVHCLNFRPICSLNIILYQDQFIHQSCYK